ncbi:MULTISPECIES: DegT/DnrJ/EryC1/StrS aminotransferase family protein [unclassified Streptomyces]|uniref:DegT/DnrJ/EryC1/StrS family aminotransferase n=1 Tax=unclassified Streptomyces TaxID=2593676 RepID=UPI0022584E3A|nr:MULTISPECIES: DegT/DnrJ/EryC1/StrS family aminotransferase [unclassified Streptomyces]MCX5329673.1 DegT/DnrJ/EryC1/StrS family aminotransferase [Streptomyces sp. NBC_00140]MCX5359088.1 DegT/DnrJ/EryC1/StrS family aminotransferase [Streptomyces sp. NBC_00124]
MNQIPLVDLKAAHEDVADEVRAGFERVLANTAFVGGDEVRHFEREYADFGSVAHCVGVANGTDALELALRVSGVGPGDEVVVPANTFIATAGAVARTGATPVLADCLPDTYLLDPQAALDAVGPATRAVVPVHLYGQMADVTALSDRLPGHVRIVEDAAQCQGATRDGRSPGSGLIAATSFYPGKNLGAYGDAGAVLTDDGEQADLVRAIANHGGVAKYRHDVPGFNSRLDGLQAVVLRAKLARLAAGNAARRAAAARYDTLLADLAAGGQVVLPTTDPGNVHVWHLYVVQVAGADRDDIVGKLNAEGIGAGVHYPAPVHLTPAYRHLGHARGDFPNAEHTADRILSLPLHPHLTADQQQRVVDTLAHALRG